MGIMTRQVGEKYVIASDRPSHDVPSKRAPNRLTDFHQVWTLSGWSTTLADAIGFDSLDDADEYVRANFSKVTS